MITHTSGMDFFLYEKDGNVVGFGITVTPGEEEARIFCERLKWLLAATL